MIGLAVGVHNPEIIAKTPHALQRLAIIARLAHLQTLIVDRHITEVGGQPGDVVGGVESHAVDHLRAGHRCIHEGRDVVNLTRIAKYVDILVIIDKHQIPLERIVGDFAHHRRPQRMTLCRRHNLITLLIIVEEGAIGLRFGRYILFHSLRITYEVYPFRRVDYLSHRIVKRRVQPPLSGDGSLGGSHRGSRQECEYEMSIFHIVRLKCRDVPTHCVGKCCELPRPYCMENSPAIADAS